MRVKLFIFVMQIVMISGLVMFMAALDGCIFRLR